MTVRHDLARGARWPSPRKLCAALGIVLAGAAGMRTACAQRQASETQVKAAFVYNFALFTTWPPGAMPPDAPMVVCVRPDHPLQAALEKLTGKPVRGHRLEIRKLNDSTAAGCHVLVIDARVANGVRVDPAAAVLVISDQPRTTRGSGPDPVISLALDGDRVVFDIDAAAARQARLELSSQLLRLARSVQ
ncbi:hypothetical protein CO705_18375 [Ralstonia pickettii]|nr:hypothetical protein CO705_18375 [Ralstonia pickettii]